MDPLAPLITALHSEGRLRVWSLVITIFGDLVQHHGGEISSTRLRALLGRVGVAQGALRTALSRLAGDGWITSERAGRSSHYRLSRQGLDRFAPATSRIYAPPQTSTVRHWAAVLTLAESGTQKLHICPADEATGDADCMIVGTLTQVSEAYRAVLLDPAHRVALAALASDLAVLEQGINTPLDAAAARMLLIHRWRRIVLRYPECLPDLMPADAPLKDPRASVARVYETLSPATEAWLESDCDGLAPLPNAPGSAPKRFGDTLGG